MPFILFYFILLPFFFFAEFFYSYPLTSRYFNHILLLVQQMPVDASAFFEGSPSAFLFNVLFPRYGNDYSSYPEHHLRYLCRRSFRQED